MTNKLSKYKYSYRVIEEECQYDLIYSINCFINDGWVCQGGINMIKGQYFTIYAQAIVKKTKIK